MRAVPHLNINLFTIATHAHYFPNAFQTQSFTCIQLKCWKSLHSHPTVQLALALLKASQVRRSTYMVKKHSTLERRLKHLVGRTGNQSHAYDKEISPGLNGVWEVNWERQSLARGWRRGRERKWEIWGGGGGKGGDRMTETERERVLYLPG